MTDPHHMSSEMIVVGRRRSPKQHVLDLWGYRELLGGLVRKELKVRYKDSALGFVWSMIQPVFLLGVYSLVFSILGAGFEKFPIWLLSGLIVWTFVSTAMSTSVQSITANGYLVSKVRFPRAVLPLSNVGASAMHLGLQLLAMAGVLAVTAHPVAWGYLWLLPFAIATVALMASTCSLVLSALNVRARDTQHLLDLAMLGWFWLTPIIYDYHRVSTFLDRKGLPDWLSLLNPITDVIITFQRAIYGTDSVGGRQLLPDDGPLWYLRNLAIVSLVSILTGALALNFFDRAEANFAEDL